MKTTLHLDDRVATAAKTYAEKEGITFTAVVNTALRQFLSRSRRPSGGFKLEIHTRDTGPQAGVDLEDRAALYELMDGR